MDLLEWLGYLASLIILVSLLMSSIIKLRWINLIGAVIFVVYGFMIGAIPVAFMNIGIVIINIYYLFKIYGTKEYFQLLEANSNSNYLKAFTEFYKDDIKHFFGTSDFKIEEDSLGFYILSNMVPAGIVIAKIKNAKTLEIELDYAVPAYRDFKLGQYLYETKKDYFTNLGFTTLEAVAISAEHAKYLGKMGFINTDENYFVKNLTT
jgi:hypothetical protein